MKGQVLNCRQRAVEIIALRHDGDVRLDANGVGDYVNASILGGTKTTMIGNIIQLEFLQNFHYPVAAALSFILMAVLLVGILIYAKVLGTRSIEDMV